MIQKLNKLIREKEKYTELEQEFIDILDELDRKQENIMKSLEIHQHEY